MLCPSMTSLTAMMAPVRICKEPEINLPAIARFLKLLKSSDKLTIKRSANAKKYPTQTGKGTSALTAEAVKPQIRLRTKEKNHKCCPLKETKEYVLGFISLRLLIF
jgi:hypothetical protein